MRVFIRSPVNNLHTPIVLSWDPETKYSPLSENATLKTVDLWSFNVLMSSPDDTLHIHIVLSPDPDAKYSPLGENLH